MLDLDLQAGKILAIQGDAATVSTLLISMAVKLQERSKVLYIDSAHTFNPAFLKESYHKSTAFSLTRILVSRPFTCDQLACIVNKLEQAVRETRAKSIIISSLDGLFFDQDADEKDAVFQLSRIMENLLLLAKRRGIVLLVGLSPRLEKSEGLMFKSVLEDAIDMVCHI